MQHNKSNLLVELSFDNGMVVQSGLAHPYYVVGKGWATYAPNMANQVKDKSKEEKSPILSLTKL